MDLKAVSSAVVPAGKLLVWLVVTGTALFMAGIGATLQFGEARSNIRSIPDIQVEVTVNAAMIEQLLDSVSVGSRERAQILCAVVIAVSGEVVTAPEVLRRCP